MASSLLGWVRNLFADDEDAPLHVNVDDVTVEMAMGCNHSEEDARANSDFSIAYVDQAAAHKGSLVDCPGDLYFNMIQRTVDETHVLWVMPSDHPMHRLLYQNNLRLPPEERVPVLRVAKSSFLGNFYAYPHVHVREAIEWIIEHCPIEDKTS